MKRLLALTVGILALLTYAHDRKIKVACMGNSITYGYLLPDRDRECYPAQLQQMLGDGYEVGNFGLSGATLLRRGHRPYTQQREFKAALALRPDIAVIHLGVNDTDPRDYPEYGDDFVSDYSAIIDSLREVNPQTRILIALLTPLKATHYRFKSGTRDWRLKLQRAIADVARAKGVELIDFNEPLRDRQDLLHDGIHPDAEGARLLALEAYCGITGNYGGLQLPMTYQSGMVLQRDTPLRINGISNAGIKITVSIGGARYTTTADNRGRWQTVTAPLVTGPVYELTVTDGTDTLRLTDILAGELWVASGQSNMEFPLSASTGGRETVANINDPWLRVLDMRAIARTNDVTWDSATVAAINRLDHFKPARWQQLTPDNAGEFSAVAYHFARNLRDSLNVPVGIISNAVGGAPCESWIDVNTLEAGIPEILIDWRGNDYVQKWAQGRARKNNPDGRHPYEPSYLFSAGIRPLGQPDIAGVIWYQGESNAHNTEVHERLFPMLADSWRRYFRNPSLPIYYAQLSSIDRPSWQVFRDSQRRMALSIPDVYMTVTSDSGDSLDVHPTRKREVGERMARQALFHTYGMTDVTPSGPEIRSAIADNGSVYLTFSCDKNLKSSDGMPLRTFEVAETDGLYLPATAEILDNNVIKLTNMDIKKPRFVRYGWQPFTRANLVNGEELPASTFKTEVDNAADFDMEPGLEYGISAPFAGMLAGKLVIAGGCNFPTATPFAAGAQKKFYKGIYTADPATMQWQRAGSLPEAMAYGATAMLPNAMVMIGGTTDSRSLNTVMKLTIEDGNPVIAPLPSLPVTIDNLAATAIGNTIYVAGGNVDGTPSTQLWSMDLDNPEPKWRKLHSMPGNPRVQPVMTAASKGADGEHCLYLWGGFAPKHSGKEATLEVDGLCYTPSENKWRTLPAPTDSTGESISLGGGSICTLSDGTIAATGGVNKDIFLNALRNQAPDYLAHPIEWYRFNPNVLVYDPVQQSWHTALTDPATARAGAAIITGSDRDCYLTGGELKPRVRTPETLHLQF